MSTVYESLLKSTVRTISFACGTSGSISLSVVQSEVKKLRLDRCIHRITLRA
jgi:hypothetical protein